jgi:hypothetical protein
MVCRLHADRSGFINVPVVSNKLISYALWKNKYKRTFEAHVASICTCNLTPRSIGCLGNSHCQAKKFPVFFKEICI